MKEVINFDSNEHLFNILDDWIEKYNTSPKTLTEKSRELSQMAIKLNSQTQEVSKRDGFLAELKEWAINNKKIVIVSGLSVVILTTSAIGTVIQKISPKTLKIEKGSFHFFDANIDIFSEITAGVYYSAKNNEIITEENTNKDEIGLLLPGRLIKNSFNQSIEEYIQERMIDVNSSKEPSIELVPIENPTLSLKSTTETPNVLSENGGIEIVIPTSVRQTGLCRNYTSYSYFYGKWSKGAGQRTLSEQWGAAGKPSSNGIATLNDRYLVAVSPKFGVVGDHIDIVLTDGQIIPATIADSKGKDATSEWGHVMTASGAVDIIEWEASGTKSDINLGSWANVPVEKIINYGKELPVYEEEPEIINEEAWQYIELYSKIYGLNEEKVYQIISGLTDNFNSEAYEQSNTIKTFGDSKTIFCNNKEMAILLSVRDIYYNLESYGVTEEEIKGNTLYQSTSSYASQIEYLSNVLGVDSNLNYSICIIAGGFNSPMFINKNNPTSIMINGDYATFPTITAGFVEQTVELLKIILNNEDPIEIIGARVSISDTWNTNALEIYNYVTNNYDVIFGASENNQVSDNILKKSIMN